MPNLVRPNYGHGCFADLPQLIQSCFTGQPFPLEQAGLCSDFLRQYDAVILVFADAFGWRFFERFADRNPFLQRIQQEGGVARWTSQFPSTTAAHVTCINSGLACGQSGVFEWQYYEPAVDAVISPLLYSFAGGKARETLKATGVQPAELYPATTFYQQLQRQGVASYIYQHREYARSTYTDWLGRGAQTKPYMTLPEALVGIRQQLAKAKTPTYFYLYFDKIDAMGHEYGPDSPQMDAEIEAFLFCMERALMQPLLGKAKNILLLLTADHGQIETNPRTAIYLNQEDRFKDLLRYLRTDRNGDILVPGGSPRDVFLYIKAEFLDEAHRLLTEQLAGKASVYKTHDLIAQGYFGPQPVSPALLGHIGELVILPEAGESVWWYEKDKFEQRFYGHHGGLSAAEMEIPLCMYSFG
ncbi:MAG: alkaline phosphatase family protein [Caldilineaceae bacterium]